VTSWRPTRLAGRGPSREALSESLIWALPVIVIGLIYLPSRSSSTPGTVLTFLVAFGLLVLAARRPDISLLTLVIVFPFQSLILAKLWSWGMPTSVVKHLGAWKEVLALGVLVAGLRQLMAYGGRLDALDRLVLGFAALVGLYALLGSQIVPGSPSGQSVRLLGFRESAGFLILFFGARHAPLGRNFGYRAGRALLAVGAITAGLGIFEAINSSAWNTFMVHTIGYPSYERIVLNNPVDPTTVIIHGSVGGADITRIGSVFVSSLDFGFWLVLPFAIGFERIMRHETTPLTMAATIVIGAALLLTQTRSAIVAGIIVAILALQPAAGRGRHWRTQAALVLAGLALIAIPGAFATGVSKRVAATNTAADNSSAGHLSGLGAGFTSLGDHPLGQGLGTAAGTGQRFNSNRVIPENYYLDVGVELGILGTLLFVAITVALIWKLRRAARRSAEPLVTSAWAAAAGLAVSAFFLQTWLSFNVAWTFWGVAGAMLYVASRQNQRGRGDNRKQIGVSADPPPHHEPAAAASS
jgi:O-Antigen ligase